MTEQNLTAKQIRQAEVDAYKANIAIYQAILANLDGDWDDDLIHLKGVEAQDAARQCSMERLSRLAALQQFEQFTNLLKTEIVECSKAEAILKVL
jgi:putative heme degradation protein